MGDGRALSCTQGDQGVEVKELYLKTLVIQDKDHNRDRHGTWGRAERRSRTGSSLCQPGTGHGMCSRIIDSRKTVPWRMLQIYARIHVRSEALIEWRDTYCAINPALHLIELELLHACFKFVRSAISDGHNLIPRLYSRIASVDLIVTLSSVYAGRKERGVCRNTEKWGKGQVNTWSCRWQGQTTSHIALLETAMKVLNVDLKILENGLPQFGDTSMPIAGNMVDVECTSSRIFFHVTYIPIEFKDGILHNDLLT